MTVETHTLRLFPPLPLPLVRDFVRRVDGHLPARVRHNLELLLTETAMNAIHYGEPPAHVEVTWLAGTARVVVTSGGNPIRWRGNPTTPAEDGGWGLMFVDHIADRWGINRMDNQNRVWFELDH
jgi:Histidine kinase-like ATPase domain